VKTPATVAFLVYECLVINLCSSGGG